MTASIVAGLRLVGVAKVTAGALLVAGVRLPLPDGLITGDWAYTL